MNKHEEIWAQIEEQRANYLKIIEQADETIRAANALKKDAREGLDALPVAKTRRPKKDRQRPIITDPTPTYGDCEDNES